MEAVMNLFSRTCCLVVVFLFAALVVTPAAGQDVHAGMDLLDTEPTLTVFDFGLTPIPADFFGPGSDPFVGSVALDGGHLLTPLCPNDDLNGIDTIVERLSDAQLPTIPSSDPIPIEIVELSLVSIAPITVTYNGGQNPEQWDIEVELSQDPQPIGQMTINRTHANGGTFDTNLPVLPRFTFTHGIEVRVLDFGLEGIPPVQFNSVGDPWEDKNPVPGSCTSNWCPIPGGPLVLNAPNAQHGVYPVCLAALIPVLSPGMAVVLFVLLLAAGAWLIRRRNRVTQT
jgi:hypothetical protein